PVKGGGRDSAQTGRGDETPDNECQRQSAGNAEYPVVRSGKRIFLRSPLPSCVQLADEVFK
ncbi:MAG: hypothetical protein ACTJGO_14900, partial [Glutamicibacter arilaitensis]|uniref:hypothetical protein n=1 Tax=Glutamicibacter arilaitensis TaxID=256701 RepID=UPI003FD3B847